MNSDSDYASSVTTPGGEEIVTPGWDEEVTVVRKRDASLQALLDVCSGNTKPTRQMKKVNSRF